MKKTKVFFGTAAILLALSAAFAFKSAKFDPPVYSYIPGQGYQLDAGISSLPCPEGVPICKDNQGFQYYAYDNNVFVPLGQQ